MLHNDIGFF